MLEYKCPDCGEIFDESEIDTDCLLVDDYGGVAGDELCPYCGCYIDSDDIYDEEHEDYEDDDDD